MNKIYKKAVQNANKKFKTKSSIYRSAFITKEYKKLGGKIKNIK
jgi:hypothetical protein